jgi:hypothetical protein
MKIVELVETLKRQGIHILVDGDSLRLRAPIGREPSPEVLDRLRRERPAILAYLHRRSASEREEETYSTLVEATLTETCKTGYPPGMIGWLEQECPDLYEELTCHLPDLISRLWAAHAPLGEFQPIVASWLIVREKACALFGEFEASRK